MDVFVGFFVEQALQLLRVIVRVGSMTDLLTVRFGCMTRFGNLDASGSDACIGFNLTDDACKRKGVSLPSSFLLPTA